MNFWSSGFWFDWIKKKNLVMRSKFEVHRAVSSLLFSNKSEAI